MLELVILDQAMCVITLAWGHITRVVAKHLWHGTGFDRMASEDASNDETTDLTMPMVGSSRASQYHVRTL